VCFLARSLALCKVLDIVPKGPSDTALQAGNGWYRIAWGFLRPVGPGLKPNVGVDMSPPARSRLQLYYHTDGYVLVGTCWLVLVVHSLCTCCVLVVYLLCTCCVLVVYLLCPCCVPVVSLLCTCCVLVVYLLCNFHCRQLRQLHEYALTFPPGVSGARS
jgi:hypothetical protein